MQRTITSYKTRPDHWPTQEEVEALGSINTPYGTWTIQKQGNMLTSKTTPTGAEPSPMISKRKYRGG